MSLSGASSENKIAKKAQIPYNIETVIMSLRLLDVYCFGGIVQNKVAKTKIKKGRYSVLATCLVLGGLMSVGYLWMAFTIIGL